MHYDGWIQFEYDINPVFSIYCTVVSLPNYNFYQMMSMYKRNLKKEKIDEKGKSETFCSKQNVKEKCDIMYAHKSIRSAQRRS